MANTLTVDEVIDEVRNAIQSGATLGIMTYLTVEFPFFALPVVNQITRLAVSYIIGVGLKETELGAYDIYVDLYTEKEAQDFQKAVEARKVATIPSDIEAANAAIVQAARTFIKFEA